MIVEVLSVLLGSSLVGTIVTSIMYWKSSKKLKEAEVTTAEASAQLKKVEAKVAQNDGEHKAREQLYEIIAEMNAQMKDVVISNGDQIDILNKHLLEEMTAKADQTDRLRKYQDELLDAKNEIIKLTSENAQLNIEVEHYKNWVCERDYSQCQIRKPEQKIKCPYQPILYPTKH